MLVPIPPNFELVAPHKYREISLFSSFETAAVQNFVLSKAKWSSSISLLALGTGRPRTHSPYIVCLQFTSIMAYMMKSLVRLDRDSSNQSFQVQLLSDARHVDDKLVRRYVSFRFYYFC